MSESQSNGAFGNAVGLIETKGWVGSVEATDAMLKETVVHGPFPRLSSFNTRM